MRPVALVGGAISQRAGRPGHALVFLQWAEALDRLGYDVTIVDQLAPDQCVDADGTSRRPVELIRWTLECADAVGWGDRIVISWAGSATTIGFTRADLVAQARRADLFVNLMGYVDDPELTEPAGTRVFVDLDPGFTQLWADDGLADVAAGHDRFLTVGTRVGAEGCDVPTNRRRWVPTLPPVVTDWWPARDPVDGPITSIGTWRGPFGPLVRRGRRLGLRVHELRRFATLPGEVGPRCRLALEIDDSDAADAALLRDGGWSLVDPSTVATVDAYRRFIAGSAAELGVAKEIHRVLRTGWFSDRSAAYLASGRPVVATATGFESALPVGEGLFAVDSVDEAVDAIAEIGRDPERHAKAARALAERHLEAADVVGDALHRAGLR